ncbi:MAG: hypothetical protein GY950_03490, partial [bacterium]|nr:hypothetical protein [bacterium]
EHKEDFKSAEQRAGNLIAFKFDDYKKDVELTPQDVYDYYKSNQTQYVEPAKTKVSRILLKHDGTNSDDILKKAEALQKELTAENFAQKAKEVSQGDKAKEGGDHGYYAWQRFSKQEKAIIGSLDQGEISTPVNTGTGFALLFVSEKVDKRQKVLNEVENIIRTTLEKRKLDALVKNKLEVIYKKIEKSENIKEQAKKLGVEVVETELLTSGGAVKDIDPGGYISRQLFQLEEKKVSTPFTFAQGMAIVQLTKIQKPEVEPLDKVKDKVKAAAVKVKKLRRLLQDAKAVTADLNNMTDEKKIEKYLKDKDLGATNSTYRRGNRLAQLPVKKGLDELIFSLAENRYSDPIDMTTEVVIVKVKTKKITAAADFETDRTEFYTQKLNEM